jgi:ribosomal protein L11 methyltransferase
VVVRDDERARSWWALIVPVSDAAHEERLVGRFDAASLGAELRDADAGRELVTYFDSREGAGAFAASLEEGLAGQVRLEELADGGWVERYQASLQPFELTPGLRVDPTGGAAPDAGTIRLVPGRAFGTGEHPTTRLSALALEKYVGDGTRWVDLGCGSAILSIVARLRGASRLLAIDLDPEATEVAAQVLQQNEIEQVELATGSYELAGSGWDGVVANILSGFFVEHAAELPRLLSPGGLLVASGYQSDEVGLMLRTLRSAGFELVEQFEADGWGAMVCRLPAAG